jgi:hypothetical protein
MGEKLLLYFKNIGDEQGIKGKVSLAQETKIPITQAAILPDSPENIELFKKAVQKLTGKA